MKIFRTGFIILFFSLLAACAKEDEALPVPQNSWWCGGDTLTTAYTDVDTRSGYRISFFPSGTIALDHFVTLQFSEYPQVGKDYQVISGDPVTGQVKVLLQKGPLPLYKSQPGGSVHVDQVEEKFSFSADNLHLLRDTIASVADALDLGFRLRAF